MKNRIYILFILLLIVFIGISCSRKIFRDVYPALNDGRYDSEFPYRNSSEQLDHIARSTVRIYCLADYKTYLLKADSKCEPEMLDQENLLTYTEKTSKTNEAASGTATIIYLENKRIALLSCAHIFNFPDTIFTYFDDNDPYTKDYLQGVSIKTNQRNFFRGYPEGNGLKILASDRDLDIAILGRITESNSEELLPFPYPLGNSDELEWGSFVYVMGFPLGYQMITRGIVSKPITFSDDAFLIDAIFNEGFSGSVVLAIRDGVPNFEMVGLGKAASVSYDNILVPAKQNQEMIYNPNVPYEGDVFVSQKKEKNYGITYAISTKSIRKFYKDHKDELDRNGYYLDKFFVEKDKKSGPE